MKVNFNTLKASLPATHKMSSLPLPPWLQTVFPGWYTDARTGKLMPLTDQEVAYVCQQYQHGLQQQQYQCQLQQQRQLMIQQQQHAQYMMQQQHVQQPPPALNPGIPRSQAHCQPPIWNYGTVNIGCTNLGSQQSGFGSHSIGSQQVCSHQQTPSVPQSSKNNLLQPSVDSSDFSLDAQTAAPDTIDLTGDDLDEIEVTDDDAPHELDDAPEPTISQEVKTVPAPAPKPDSKFWRNGSAHLKLKLNNVGNSNQYFLFGSLQEIEPATKRHKYAAAHWPSDEAAYEDIMNMSSYFVDATEMLSYRMRWNSIEADLASGTLTLEQENALRENLAKEKSRLQAEMPSKRQNKLDRGTKAAEAEVIMHMSRDRFLKKYGMKASQANRDKAIRDFAAGLDAERAEERAPKRACVDRAGGPRTERGTGDQKKRRAGGTRVTKARPKMKAKSKVVTSAPVADPLFTPPVTPEVVSVELDFEAQLAASLEESFMADEESKEEPPALHTDEGYDSLFEDDD